MTGANGNSEVLSRSLELEVAHVTELAAIACAKLIGRGDKMAADAAAVDAMRAALSHVDIAGKVVIGEGEMDEAPMLYIGEEVGTGKGPKVDIAVDPLEGTNLCAKAMPNALAVLAMGVGGGLLHAPDMYMDKVAVGPGYSDGVVDLDASVDDNLNVLAREKGVPVSEITVCLLDRDRHEEKIAAVRKAGARVQLITDGDIAGVMWVSNPDETGIDMYLGSGGAPEGVLAAAALAAVGGQMQGRLLPETDQERARAVSMGIADVDKKLMLQDMVSKDAIFCATGVTGGALLDGVIASPAGISTDTIVMHSAFGTTRRIQTIHPIQS